MAPKQAFSFQSRDAEIKFPRVPLYPTAHSKYNFFYMILYNLPTQF